MMNSRRKDKLIQMKSDTQILQKELDQNINKKESQQWLHDKYLTSHFKAYTCAVKEQKIATKCLINQRQRDNGKTLTISNVDFAKQISKTSLILSVHALRHQVGTTHCYMIQ